MENKKMEIEQEMNTAGSESISNVLIDMDTHRVMMNSKMEEEEYLFKLKGMKCFPRKDLTAISGGPKTGKTNWISMLLACALKGGEDRKVLDLERVREEKLRVMWIDTEQSPQSTQSILRKRVCPMVLGEGAENIKEFPEELLFVFNIRSVDVDSRYDLIALLRSLKVDYPTAEIVGHCELKGVRKACPCFEVSEYRDYFKNLK